MRVVTLGTAGHIDHGKTALVRALTGIDTDRLPEEKRRGITIDLGFAHLDLAPDLRLAIVDVPGHEAFVRNMTAGATGIDLGLLVIAADEGVMPQTREHLAILELLAVQPAAVVLTKSDLVDPEWLELVEGDVMDNLRGAYANAPIVRVSSKTGEGLAELRAVLLKSAEAIAPRNRDDLFRLPIDRVFSVRGTGTVVTGTVWTGELALDQIVRLLPSEASARVRGLQRQGETAKYVSAGERAAVALANLAVESISRGETLVSDPAWSAARTLTAFINQLADARHPLQTRQRVHVYLGTASVLARAYPLSGPIEPGDQGWALLYLEERLTARVGDRLILRSYSPVTTIAGGEVLEWSLRPYRRRAVHLPILERLRSPRFEDRCSAALQLAGWAGLAIDAARLRIPRFVQEVSPPGFFAGSRWFDSELAAESETSLLTSLERLHQSMPTREAVDTEQLRTGVPRRIPALLRDAVLQRLITSGRIVERPGGLALPGWKPLLNPRHEQVRIALLETLTSAGLTPPERDRLTTSIGPEVPELLRLLAIEGQVVAVSRDFFMIRSATEQAEQKIREALNVGPMSVPQLKAVLGVSRKHLIPLLEHFDRAGLTLRNGDLRTLARVKTVSDIKDATA
ncbi:MAG: selenocysteine-specific translation elongation factor [Gemmatimonadota bacterium]